MLKTTQWMAIAVACSMLIACGGGGGGGGGSSAPNCAAPQMAGTPQCLNAQATRMNARPGGPRTGFGLATGTYIRGTALGGKVQLNILNVATIAALCQQAMDSSQGGVALNDGLVSGIPNYANNVGLGYASYGLCTNASQTIFTFFVDQSTGAVRWRFYFNNDIPSPIFEGKLMLTTNGFQALGGWLGTDTPLVDRKALLFTAVDTGTALSIQISVPGVPNGVIATGTMTPSLN